MEVLPPGAHNIAGKPLHGTKRKHMTTDDAGLKRARIKAELIDDGLFLEVRVL